MFWSLESCYIIMTDILWHDLHGYMCHCPYNVRTLPSNCICLLPHSICNARHAWTLALTLHYIMILHPREREPIKSLHWACEYDVCSVICDLHNRLEIQILSATRHVKISRKFTYPARHGSYGNLEEDTRVCLKTSSICHPSRSWPQHLFWNPRKNGRKTWHHRCSSSFLQYATHAACLLSSLRLYRGLHHLTNPMHT